MLVIFGMLLMLVLGVVVGFIAGLIYVGDDCDCDDDIHW
jgi:uncharacterized membrane protein YeaQ/YmgE (transglycosylase-associated protein family)